MLDIKGSKALIVGAGPGIRKSLGRLLVDRGVNVALAALDLEKLRPLASEIGALPFLADASDARSVATLFADAEEASRTNRYRRLQRFVGPYPRFRY